MHTLSVQHKGLLAVWAQRLTIMCWATPGSLVTGNSSMLTIKYYIIWLEELDERKERDWEHIFIAAFCLFATVVCIRCECGWKDFIECSFILSTL